MVQGLFFQWFENNIFWGIYSIDKLVEIFISTVLSSDQGAQLNFVGEKTIIVVSDIPVCPVICAINLRRYSDFFIFLRSSIKNYKDILGIGIHLPSLLISKF